MGVTQRLGTIPLAIQTDSSNNVGIGATPSGSFKLEVTGASKLSGFLGVNGSPATSFPFEAYINSSTAYSSTSRGNVMRVYNANTGANVFAGIELGGAGTANDGLAGINAAVTGSGSASLNFYTRNSGTFEEKLRLDSNGQLNMSPYHSNAKFCPGADSNHYLRYLTSLDGLELAGYSGVMLSTLGGTERLKVDTYGRVTMISQPSFYATSTAGSTSYTASEVIVFNTTRHNIGSYYNTSNGRFTAPVAGRYLFTFNCYAYGGYTTQITLTINGSQYEPQDVNPLSFMGASSSLSTGFTLILQLSAGDYVEPRVRTGGSAQIYRAHSHFSGCLLS